MSFQGLPVKSTCLHFSLMDFDAHTFPTLLWLKDTKHIKGNKSTEKPFLTTYNLEKCRALSYF
jgi:hypothetical protein